MRCLSAMNGAVPPYRSAWVEDATEAEVRAFLSERGMPLADTPADHIGTLLLAASWLEDQSTEDESEALETLFSEYLLPWCGAFLGKVEAHATTPFWRTMAPLTVMPLVQCGTSWKKILKSKCDHRHS